MAHEPELSALELLDRTAAAEYISKPVKTLDNWRSAGRGPAYYRIGGSIRYDRRDLAAWLDQNRVEPA